MSTTTEGILSRYASNGYTTNAVGDYSVNDNAFILMPPTDEVWDVTRLILYIEDTGSFDSGGYGNGGALANGIQMHLMRGNGVIEDLLDGLVITKNTHWKRQCYDIGVSTFGSGNESLGARWTFAKAGASIRLRGENEEHIKLTLSDDLSNLVEHRFLFQGLISDFTHPLAGQAIPDTIAGGGNSSFNGTFIQDDVIGGRISWEEDIPSNPSSIFWTGTNWKGNATTTDESWIHPTANGYVPPKSGWPRGDQGSDPLTLEY